MNRNSVAMSCNISNNEAYTNNIFLAIGISWGTASQLICFMVIFQTINHMAAGKISKGACRSCSAWRCASKLHSKAKEHLHSAQPVVETKIETSSLLSLSRYCFSIYGILSMVNIFMVTISAVNMSMVYIYGMYINIDKYMV